ncbi:cell adhesion molecule Dscam2-like [Uloborus diversus]|uniref:cell adhesion molecule Dscam2-like n=1 Tax=Uloborus diversus TaxID=327109 RepID=UPI00240A9B96|nr:cell adhesion molecule Dscam2-like [Uloborus diversus]
MAQALDIIISECLPPKLIPLPRSAQLRKGERYHVTCSTSDGSPPLTFSWSKDGEGIEAREQPPDPTEIAIRKLDDFSSSLVVEDVQEQHSGNYSCTVANAAGRDTGTTSLQVLFAPNWVRPPSDTSVEAGNKITLHCEAKGSPKPTITWRKNTDFSAINFDVVHSDGRVRISDDGQSLRIPEARKEDEGFYECHVTNGIGDQLRKSIRVEVQVPPKVASGPGTLVVERNKDVTIQCNMTGDSPLNIMWEKNGKSLEDRRPRIQIHELPTERGVTTSLVLTHVDRSSSGLYVCKAKNSYGESYRIINIDVVEIPGQPKELMVSQIWSRSIQLTWTSPYHGNRPITAYIIHYWRTEGKSAPPPEKPDVLRIPSLQTIAVVPGLLPNSFYRLMVMAENDVGVGIASDIVSATTRDEEPDWAPAEVSVLDKHSTSCKLKWRCPQRSEWTTPLNGYYIGYKRMSQKSAYTYRTLKENVCKNHQEYVLHGLEKDSSYLVIVKAYNHVGTGPPSEQVVVRTADGAPPRTPHVKVVQTGGVTCHLKIWPRENSRSLPTEFVLHVRESNGDRHRIPVSVLPSQNYSVGGLSPGRQYEIYVTALNLFGESNPSATIKIITDQTDPSLEEHLSDPIYKQPSFVIPIALSLVAIVIMGITACYCHNKLNPRPIPTELIEDRDFLYAAATLHRLDATLRRASATLSRAPIPARTSSLPRPARSHRATTTTLPSPEPQPVPKPEPSPALPTSYSTLQNYGTAAAQASSEGEEAPVSSVPSSPPVSKAAIINLPDDSRYDSVVEEMRTFIKDKGSTKPKKIEAEAEPAVVEDDSSDDS